MLLQLNHNVFYGTTIDVPLPEIARSLLATEQTVRRLPPILEKMFPGLCVASIEVGFSKAESGSLAEDFILKIVCDYQKNIEDAISGSGERWGMDVLVRKKTLISHIIMALLLLGAGYAISLVSSSPDAGINVKGDQNIIINAAGNISGVTPDQLKAILETTASSDREQRKLAKEAVDFFAPAKIEPNVRVMSGSDILVSSTAVGEIPTRQQLEKIEDDEFQREFKDVELDVRVIDRDKSDHGWKAVIPSLGERRVKLMLAPVIDLDKFAAAATKGPIRGDVIVEFIRLPTGEDRPVLIHFMEVRDENIQ